MQRTDDTNFEFATLLKKVTEIISSAVAADDKLLATCKLLRQEVPYYDWVGFYLVDPAQTNELVLGPFVGDPTEHERIAFGQGICGQAAERNETFVVQDVSKESNYSSCSANVKSEIVVPILKNGQIIGELDIDSHALAPFSQEDKEFLGKVCEKIADLF